MFAVELAYTLVALVFLSVASVLWFSLLLIRWANYYPYGRLIRWLFAIVAVIALLSLLGWWLYYLLGGLVFSGIGPLG
jgi:hypothetical protein